MRELGLLLHGAATAMPMTTGAGRPDPLIGAVLGDRYRIQRLLGRGGMGAVYEGGHIELGRPVAVKVLAAELTGSEVAVERFLREARTASKLGHPNIVDVYDLGRLDDGRPYLVMERLRGESLSDLLAREGSLPPARVAEIARQTASALDALHARGAVHRDVKPDNLFVAARDDGTRVVKLLDFGLVGLTRPSADYRKLTQTGLIYGTPEYMAPEAASDVLPDHRSDVYSLAVVVFELLAGRVPFDADNPLQVLMQKTATDPPSLAEVAGRPFPASLERAVARGMARIADERFQSAGELASAVSDAVDRAPVRSVATGPGASGAPASAVLPRTAGRREVARAAPAAPGTEPRPRTTERHEVVLQPEPLTRRAASRTSSPPAAGTKPDDEPVSLPIRSRLPWAAAAVAALTVAGVSVYLVIADRPAPGDAGEVAAPPPGSGASAEPSTPEETDEAPPLGAPPGPGDGTSAEPAQPPDVAPEGAPEALPPRARDPSPAGAARRGQPTARNAVERSPPTSSETSAQQVVPPDAPPHTTPPEPAADTDAHEAPDSDSAAELTRSATSALVHGRIAEAADGFRRATQRSPGHAAAWRGLGIASQRLGHTPEAIRAYERYLTLSPDAPDAEAVRQRIRSLGGG